MAAGADINADERILRYAIHLRDLYAVKVRDQRLDDYREFSGNVFLYCNK